MNNGVMMAYPWLRAKFTLWLELPYVSQLVLQLGDTESEKSKHW